MNRAEYMTCLAYQLKRLPREDYDRAMAYFEEYFDEAGEENEQQAINDLGTPEMAANQIIMDMAIKKVEEPNKSVKHGFRAVWIAILAVFAAPIGLPLALAAVVLIFAFLIVIAALIFSVVVTAVAFGVTSIFGLLCSIVLIFVSPMNGLATFGMAAFFFGLGIFVIYGCFKLCKLLLNVIGRLAGRLIKGGRRK